MPRHAAWHCIIQQAALCCFISSVAAVFWHLGALEHSSHFEARSTDVLASASPRRGQQRRLEACSTGGSSRRPASLVDVARHGDPRHVTVTRITGGSLHMTESGTARRPAAQVYGTVSAVGRYNWRAGGRLSHGTGLCTAFVLARHYSARYLAPCKTGTGHCIAPYQSCRTDGLHTNCTCILLTNTNYV